MSAGLLSDRSRRLAARIIAPHVAPVLPAPVFVGIAIGGTGSISYPAGTTTGDFCIALAHNFSGSTTTPTGYSSVFTTPGDAYSYAFNVSTRVIQAGDTSSAVSIGASGFSSALVVLRNVSSVSGSYAYNNVGSGGSNTLSVLQNGTGIVIATDRGASDFPTISGGTNTTTGSVAYFRAVVKTFFNYTSGTSITYTDINDTYNTTGLLLIAQ